MRVIAGGASGFLGAPLLSHLRERGHDVVQLARGNFDHDLIASGDVVINLGGAPISQWPRTRSRAAEILRSRVETTTALAEAVAAAPSPPAFLSGSGISWYGVDRGAERLRESDATPSDGFLADVAQAWERAAEPAVRAGARVAFLRTAIALDSGGGAMKFMTLPFKLGLGARLGSGEQFFSVISRHDWVRAVTFLVEHEVSGPVNLTAPRTPTNAEFTRELARQLHRPAPFAAPSFALKLALGGLAEDLLGSLRVEPTVLTEAGFTFDDPTLPDILARALPHPRL